MAAPGTAQATEPGDALKAALKENAREIGVLALGMAGQLTLPAEQFYDQSPAAQELFLEVAATQMRRTLRALGRDYAALARSAGLVD